MVVTCGDVDYIRLNAFISGKIDVVCVAALDVSFRSFRWRNRVKR